MVYKPKDRYKYDIVQVSFLFKHVLYSYFSYKLRTLPFPILS